MKSQLRIEQLPSNYLLASVATDSANAPNYITSPKGKPLKFVSIAHIKEFFEGQRIDEVLVVDNAGNAQAVDCW
ncbi:MAG TPA: hypothetical protein VIC26_02000 [Marinagarivorans sp.]